MKKIIFLFITLIFCSCLSEKDKPFKGKIIDKTFLRGVSSSSGSAFFRILCHDSVTNKWQMRDFHDFSQYKNYNVGDSITLNYDSSPSFGN